MIRRFVADSCADFTKEQKEKLGVVLVPLTLSIGGEHIIDDESFHQKSFLEKMKNSPECPHSACPSPERYMKAYEGADEVFVVTLSSKLSGSYDSAVLAKNLYQEEHPEAKITVVDSLSASVAESLIVFQLYELSPKYDFETLTKKIESYRDSLQTKFVLEDLEVFRKNGRLTGVQALLCNALNIKPVLGGKNGEIVKIDQARGVERTLKKMVDHIAEDAKEPTTRTLAISHCNHPKRAEEVKQMILSRVPFKECLIIYQAGVSTMYANDGGIIVVY